MHRTECGVFKSFLGKGSLRCPPTPLLWTPALRSSVWGSGSRPTAAALGTAHGAATLGAQPMDTPIGLTCRTGANRASQMTVPRKDPWGSEAWGGGALCRPWACVLCCVSGRVRSIHVQTCETACPRADVHGAPQLVRPHRQEKGSPCGRTPAREPPWQCGDLRRA